MNNSTVEQFNIKVKLRGDNMYDLYVDAEHVATRGSYKGIVEEINITGAKKPKKLFHYLPLRGKISKINKYSVNADNKYITCA